MILLVLALNVAFAQASPDGVAIARQRARVTELASVAAHARDDGAPRSQVAAAMKAYRQEAETLAALLAAQEQAAVDQERQVHEQALAELEEALAAGRPAPSGREVMEAWLGDLDVQLNVLRQALDLAADRPDRPLSQELARDVADKADVVGLVAAYDGARHRSDAREIRLRATVLRSRDGAGLTSGMDTLLEARALDAEADRLEALAQADQDRVERAAAMKHEAVALEGVTP
ncbi:MAG: hypothetical protein H6742_10170 [Alphaproteobacteria bacterium]|nr:hypothetical protein [Alphaproteobacteria bacterium]